MRPRLFAYTLHCARCHNGTGDRGMHADYQVLGVVEATRHCSARPSFANGGPETSIAATAARAHNVGVAGRVHRPFGPHDDSAKISSQNGFSEGVAAVSLDLKLWGYINTHGETVIPAQFTGAMPFSEGLALVTFPHGTVPTSTTAVRLQSMFLRD
jgi:WG containing repeat